MTYPLRRPEQPPYDARPRRKGRRTRKLVAVLVVLILVLLGADFGAAAFAEHTVSQKTREQFGITDDPSVSIHGFPFLSQAISGDYSHMSVRAGGVPLNDALRELEFSAELRDVSAPLSDLTSGNVQAIKIGRLEGQIRIKASDIARINPLNKIDDLRIEPANENYVRQGGNGDSDSEDSEDSEETTTTTSSEDENKDSAAGVRLSGHVQIAGEEVELFAFCVLELEGNSMHISPQRLQFGNDKETTVVPPEVQQQLLPDFDATVDPGGLPFQVTPTAVDVDSGAVIIKGKAKDVTFAGTEQGPAAQQGK